MPLSLSNAAIQQFKLQFELEFQATEKLANTSMELMGLRGDAYKIPLMGEAVTTDRGAYQSLISASDVDVQQKSIVFKNWTVNLPLDYFQEHEVAGNTLSTLSQDHAKAMGRRIDQTKIDALVADHGHDVAVGAPGTNLTVEKIKEAKSFMDENNVPGDDRYLIVSPSQIDALLGDETVTNILYNNQRTLVNGDIDTFLGFKFITLGNYPEGGLPYDAATTTRTCFAWAKPSVYTGFQIPPSVDVQWSAMYQSWLTISRLRLGAKVTQDKGVVAIECDEA
jgi:hypothetical protein